MKHNVSKAQTLQRTYYEDTATRYDDMHLHAGDEHYLALSFLIGSLDFFDISSVLDVGAGTGRALLKIKQCRPSTILAGIEPVAELRQIGHKKGLSSSELIDGDGLDLQYNDSSWDLVCSFGLLHHLAEPELAIREMLRVSKKVIFISDSNNFGQGSRIMRAVKQVLNAVGMWHLANFVKTRGAGYSITERDGLAYSYSLFTNYRQIRRHCRTIYLLNKTNAGINAYRSASHIVLLGVKGDAE